MRNLRPWVARRDQYLMTNIRDPDVRLPRDALGETLQYYHTENVIANVPRCTNTIETLPQDGIGKLTSIFAVVACHSAGGLGVAATRADDTG